MSENIENESHLRGVIEQLQTRNRAMEREARNGRAIIGSLRAAMREDSEHFFEQNKEIRHCESVVEAVRSFVQPLRGTHFEPMVADLIAALDALEKARQD